MPSIKAKQFRHEKDKFAAAGLTPRASEIVEPKRIDECPVQLEARVNHLHKMQGEKLDEVGGGIAAEVEILRVHAAEDVLVPGKTYVDPAKWSPLIYNFRHYFRLDEKGLGKTFRAEA